jgi:hypothetical protein
VATEADRLENLGNACGALVYVSLSRGMSNLANSIERDRCNAIRAALPGATAERVKELRGGKASVAATALLKLKMMQARARLAAA